MEKPFYFRELQPNNYRRADHHDYTKPAKYMITLNREPGTLPLSRVVGDPRITDPSDPAFPHVELTQEGTIVEKYIGSWSYIFPCICVSEYIIMPDHIHMAIDVSAELERGLGKCIGSLKGKISAEYFRLQNPEQAELPNGKIPSFFAEKFNDRIAYTCQQWETQKRYVKDNPRRYLIKKLFPDFFFRRFRIIVGEREFMGMGNIFLLKEPQLYFVKYSRIMDYDKIRFDEWRNDYLGAIRNSAVLISPFIHPREKEARDAALRAGGSIISVQENGFSERQYPFGRYFDLAAAGRYLIIGGAEYRTGKMDNSYTGFHKLNYIAKEISGIDWNREEGRIKPV